MSSNGAARYLLLNYMKMDAHNVEQVTETLGHPRPTDMRFPRSVYKHEAGDRLMELVAVSGLAGLGELLVDASWLETEKAVRPRLAVDFRRQLHELRDVVKPSASLVPSGPNLHLSRMEVHPEKLEEYHGWRARTLFPYLQQRGEVAALSAYHSLVSTEPGVLLLALFSCSLAQYRESLQTPEYRALVQQAGEQFIVGGITSLHTSMWAKV